MKIGIDARLWNETGVGRYIRNLIINLSKIDNKNTYILFVKSKDEEEIRKNIGTNFEIVKSNIKWHSLNEQVAFSKIIGKEEVDLMHFPYFSLPVFYKGKFVITIHDLILHHFITGEASSLPYWLYGFKMLSYRVIINIAARKSKKIIAVSRATKNEIIDHLRVDPEKIEIISESADDFKNYKNIKNIYGKYFLFVGNIYPHKNIKVLIKAFKIFAEKNEVKLIFVGKKDYFYKKLENENKDLIKSGKIIILENVNDQELSGLYSNSVGLIRSSLMEGFSLPPLEALESNTLVLASGIPVHKEILGDSVIYFDPESDLDLVSKMEHVVNLNTREREAYLKKGRERLKNFSWEITARKTLQVYESCAGIRQDK